MKCYVPIFPAPNAEVGEACRMSRRVKMAIRPEKPGLVGKAMSKKGSTMRVNAAAHQIYQYS